MSANVVDFKQPPKAERTRMQTLYMTPALVKTWVIPPFQRQLRVNEKVRTIAGKIKADEVVPGIVTIGEIERGPDRGSYLMDGQHRVEAFKLSELTEAIADVHFRIYDTMAEMGAAFVEINSQIVRMRPDDNLRGLEQTIPALGVLRKHCTFIGYDYVRRGPKASAKAPILGMSNVIKVWSGSNGDTPSNTGSSTMEAARQLGVESAQQLSVFLNMCFSAWGREMENRTLWMPLNLAITMWLWRRLVLDKQRGVTRYVVLTPDLFRKCLLSVAASSEYADWLVGRTLSERDRSPCYTRLRPLFVTRLNQEMGKKILFPQPAWAARASR